MPEELDDAELLYRRILKTWVSADGTPPSFESFRPRNTDTDGLSLWRGRFKSMMEISLSQRPGATPQYVGVVTVGALRKLGINVVVDPQEPVDQAHVIATNLTYANRRDEQQEGWQQQLAFSCEVYDPATDPARRVWPV
jgi:hypothetical protein